MRTIIGVRNLIIVLAMIFTATFSVVLEAVESEVSDIVSADSGISSGKVESMNDAGETGENASMSDLVGQAVAGAEEASEQAGVEYYGKEQTGVLGNRLWFADIGIVIPDDSDGTELDNAPIFSTGFNFPVISHLDISFGVSYSHQEGTILLIEYEPYTGYDIYSDYYFTYYVPRTRYRTVLVERDIEINTFSGNATLTLSLLPFEQGLLFQAACLSSQVYLFQRS